MAKALLGTYAPPRTVALLDEVRVLRMRVAELERALAETSRVRDDRLEATLVDIPEPVGA